MIFICNAACTDEGWNIFASLALLASHDQLLAEASKPAP